MKIYFVRHGQTQWNKEGKFQGSKDSPLTEEGIFQGEKLKEKFIKENFIFNKVYSSPLGRATSTAKIITNNKCEIELIDDLKEISVGDMEGVPFSEFIRYFPKEYKDFFENPCEYNPKAINGETFQSLMKRVEKGLRYIVKNNNCGDKILVVAHGITLRAIFSYMRYGNLDLNNFLDAPIPENTSLTEVIYKNNKYEIIDFSNVEHLK